MQLAACEPSTSAVFEESESEIMAAGSRNFVHERKTIGFNYGSSQLPVSENIDSSSGVDMVCDLFQSYLNLIMPFCMASISVPGLTP